MDRVYAQIAKETITFGPTDDVKWRDLFTPFYPPAPADIKVYRNERYGEAQRNLLDVFVSSGKDVAKPVLVYIHGGGFFSGDKQWNVKVYSNVGYHFAQQGIITVVANHQLVPHVQYPGGADDMQLIREWVFNNISSAKFGGGSPEKVFLFGHSSGGAHLCMNIFSAGDSERSPMEPLVPPVAGLLLIDVPFWYDRRKPVRANTLRNYYGSDEEDIWGPKSALGLFQRLPTDSPVRDSRKLPIFVGSVEWEIPETTDAMVMFLNAYRAVSRPAATLPTLHILKKHNHLSNILSIGTKDTAQAGKILEFVKDCLRCASLALK